MNEATTEREYPVQWIWVLKPMLKTIWIFIYVLFLYFILKERYPLVLFLVFFLPLPLYCLSVILQKINFHYTIEDKVFVLKQGFITKKQSYIPYGAMQNILISQDLLDKVLGLVTLKVENASQGAGNIQRQRKLFTLEIGFNGNQIIIPGLLRQHAEFLRENILQKIKENPTTTIKSGL